MMSRLATNVDADGIPVGWKPLPKQWLAMRAPARELLYGGEKGAAKTEFLVACWLKLLALAQRKFDATGIPQMKCRIIIFRKNLDDLKDWIAKSHLIYKLAYPGAVWHVNDKTWTFPSGATITVRHLDGPTDHLGYHGQELIGIGFDQVEQISWEAYSFICLNCRSGDPEYHAARMIRSTANPGGYDWVATHFKIDECPEGGKVFKIEVTNADGSKHYITRVFIRARLRDNPYLSADYEAQLRSLMNEDEIAMYLEGDFFRVAGSFFSRFLRPKVHFIKSRPIPGSWEMSFSIDWGSDAPASMHVGALDNDRRLWVIDELHCPGQTGSIYGEKMREKWRHQAWSKDRVWDVGDFYGVIDDQAMDDYGTGTAAADGIIAKGFRIWPANKDRLAGCNQMKERLLMNRRDEPQVVIFEDRCPELVKALSKIKSNAPEKPDEYDPKSDYAHACDDFRFLCMRFPLRKEREAEKADAEFARWQQIIAAQKRAAPDTERMSGGYDD